MSLKQLNRPLLIHLSKKSENTFMQRNLYDRCIYLLNVTRNGSILLQRKLNRKGLCLFRSNRATKNSFLYTVDVRYFECCLFRTFAIPNKILSP